jgi:ankyrin repeat protein
MRITVQDVSIGLKECHSASIEKMDDILAKLSDHMMQTKELRSMTEDLVEKLAEANLSRTGSQTSTRPPSYHERYSMDENDPNPSENTKYLHVRASCYRKTCSPWCSCRCHIRRSFRTPELTKKFFGSLFVGYGGMPIITQPCNERQCRKPSSSKVVLSYQFPDWFWSRSLLLSFMTASAAGPELLIRIPNTIPYASETYQHCLDGNVAGLLRLFKKKIASPFDLDPKGVSLLSNALRFDHFSACRLLMSEGADPFHEDHTGFSAYHNAWDRILFEALEPRFSRRKQALLELFPQDEGSLDERQFSRIHKSVLGIIGTKLKDELDISTSTIDDIDNLGRTPLWWASRRCDVGAVTLLLEYGACCEPLGMRDGGSPLLAAATAGNEEIVRLLLEHNPDIRACEETTRNSLHLASMVPSGTECVKLLLKAGAEVDCRDNDNLTALHYAISYGCIQNAEVLLAAGADIDALCQDGWTALACAVFWNMHESIKLLLEHGADTLSKTEPGESLLHLAACYGDETTLRILASRSLGPLDVKAKTVAGWDMHRIAEDRDETPSWYAALEDLLTSTGHAIKKRGSVAGVHIAKLSMRLGIEENIRPDKDKDEAVWIEEVPEYDSDTGHFEDALEQLIL